MYYKLDLKIEMFLDESRIKDMLGLLSLYFDKPLILINRQLDKQTKQMVCGYALGHYLEHQLLMDLHTLNKFLTIKDKHILLYEHNAFTSHLMLDSDEVYQMTECGLDAAQIAAVSASFADCFSAICVAKSAVTILGLFLLPFVLGIGHKPLSYYDSSIISQV